MGESPGRGVEPDSGDSGNSGNSEHPRGLRGSARLLITARAAPAAYPKTSFRS
ncbi:hypothetical protein GCM10009839_66890 [Catenulispora yoronensis]|uniref:Uncharacterized protein n=1 Tax=Catenulispora yoronensis TaxID=450799 RepID=A0ABN2V4G8_9ACTN